jgi:hypothetical protein
MPQTFFESTALPRVNYDAVSQCLEVEFRDRTIYRYSGVSAEIHAALLDAESQGKFFNTAIRNRFPFVPLPPSPAPSRHKYSHLILALMGCRPAGQAKAHPTSEKPKILWDKL